MVFAVSLAFASIAALFVWSATDASFRMASWKAKVWLGITPIRAADPQAAEALGLIDAMRRIDWDGQGKRVVGLCVLHAIGLASTAGLVLLTLVRPTSRSTIGCAIAIAAWAALFSTRQAVDDWLLRREVNAILPRFEAAAAELENQWPDEPGIIPPGMRFFVSAERYPDILLLQMRREPYPFHEDFGPTITRGQQGIIRFDLMATWDSCVEFHPNGTRPSAYISGFGNPSPPVESAIRLKEHWFLVRYVGS